MCSRRAACSARLRVRRGKGARERRRAICGAGATAGRTLAHHDVRPCIIPCAPQCCRCCRRKFAVNGASCEQPRRAWRRFAARLVAGAGGVVRVRALPPPLHGSRGAIRLLPQAGGAPSARHADVVALILGTTSDGRRRHVVILDQDSLVRDETQVRG